MKSIHLSKAEKARKKMEVQNVYIQFRPCGNIKRTLSNFCQKKLKCHIFNVILEVAF